jgi:CRP-like cAMP-binding protein
MATRTIHQKGDNLLLGLLSRTERRAVESDMEPIELKMREMLFQGNQEIDSVYFPLSGVMSLIVTGAEKPVEVGTIGNEGMVGTPVFLGTAMSPTQAFAQIPGRALRMKAADFRARVGQLPRFEWVIARYTQALINQISQTVACNLLHSVEQRMCRWLLITHDRVGADEFPMTQEFLGQMLGVRRASVSVVAGMLQGDGLISYLHGRIRILDRAALESSSCLCYRLVRQEYGRLLEPDGNRTTRSRGRIGGRSRRSSRSRGKRISRS